MNLIISYGAHLGNAIIAILYAVDPEIIILGGSVSKAYSFYQSSLWEKLRTFAYSPVVDRLTIQVSNTPYIAILGAAALYYDKK